MKSNNFDTLDGTGLRIAIAAARFNADLTDAMVDDCIASLKTCNISDDDIDVIRVPGSFELPVTASALVEREAYDAIICIGVIIKGDTKHDHYIADSVANGLTTVSLEYNIPVIFGVLTTENLEQAQVRALGTQKKGWEAGLSAVEMALIMKDLAE